MERDKRKSLEARLAELESEVLKVKQELAMYYHMKVIPTFDRTELKAEDIRAMGIDYKYKPYTQVLPGYCGTAYFQVPKDIMNRDYFERNIDDWVSGRLDDFNVEDFLLNTSNE